MEQEDKKEYMVPTTEVVELHVEGIVCNSPGAEFNGFGLEDEWISVL